MLRENRKALLIVIDGTPFLKSLGTLSDRPRLTINKGRMSMDRKHLLALALSVALTAPALGQAGGGGGGAGGGGAGSASGGASAGAGSSGSASTGNAATGTATNNSTTSGVANPSAPQATPNQSTNYFDPGTPATNLAIQNGQNGAVVSTNRGQAGQTSSSEANPNNNQTPLTNPQNSTQSTVAAEQKAAVTGANTKAGGVVSAPNVGVGHAANGLPIGSSGSGPGSPEQPIGGK